MAFDFDPVSSPVPFAPQSRLRPPTSRATAADQRPIAASPTQASFVAAVYASTFRPAIQTDAAGPHDASGRIDPLVGARLDRRG